MVLLDGSKFQANKAILQFHRHCSVQEKCHCSKKDNIQKWSAIGIIVELEYTMTRPATCHKISILHLLCQSFWMDLSLY